MFLNTFFFYENNYILIQISLKFVPEGPIDRLAALVQLMAQRETGEKQWFVPMMTQFNDT